MPKAGISKFFIAHGLFPVVSLIVPEVQFVLLVNLFLSNATGRLKFSDSERSLLGADSIHEKYQIISSRK